MSKGNEKLETGKQVQAYASVRTQLKRNCALNRELKDANEEIEEMNDMILRGWERLGDEKLKKESAIRRYRIVRSSS